MGVLNVSTSELLPGMIVAEDVYTKNGERILFKNTLLNPKLISKVQFYGLKEIIVFVPKSLSKAVEVPDEHINKIKESEDFKQFQKNYFTSIEQLKDSFHSVLDEDSMTIDPDKIFSASASILEEATNSIYTFEMLHCMRDYDDSIYFHSLNVALIARAFGSWLNFKDEDINQLTLAGLIHDIGKLLIPNDIITKPDTLTPPEYEIVKKHTILGYQLVKDLTLDSRIKDAILMHHERSDGSGYPHKLKNPEITSFAKIIAISDVYDAMTANRAYRNGICPFDVVEEFEKDGYTQYDVAYLLCFLEHIVQSYVNAPVRLSNSAVGEVVLINKQHLSRPVVKVGTQFIDLSKNTNLKIVNII